MKLDNVIEVVGMRCRKKGEPRPASSRLTPDRPPASPEQSWKPHHHAQGQTGHTAAKINRVSLPTSGSWRRIRYYKGQEQGSAASKGVDDFVSREEVGVKVKISFVDCKGRVRAKPRSDRSLVSSVRSTPRPFSSPLREHRHGYQDHQDYGGEMRHSYQGHQDYGGEMRQSYQSPQDYYDNDPSQSSGWQNHHHDFTTSEEEPSHSFLDGLREYAREEEDSDWQQNPREFSEDFPMNSYDGWGESPLLSADTVSASLCSARAKLHLPTSNNNRLSISSNSDRLHSPHSRRSARDRAFDVILDTKRHGAMAVGPSRLPSGGGGGGSGGEPDRQHSAAGLGGLHRNRSAVLGGRDRQPTASEDQDNGKTFFATELDRKHTASTEKHWYSAASETGSQCTAAEADQRHPAAETDQRYPAAETDQLHSASETNQHHTATEEDCKKVGSSRLSDDGPDFKADDILQRVASIGEPSLQQTISSAKADTRGGKLKSDTHCAPPGSFSAASREETPAPQRTSGGHAQRGDATPAQQRSSGGHAQRDESTPARQRTSSGGHEQRGDKAPTLTLPACALRTSSLLGGGGVPSWRCSTAPGLAESSNGSRSYAKAILSPRSIYSSAGSRHVSFLNTHRHRHQGDRPGSVHGDRSQGNKRVSFHDKKRVPDHIEPPQVPNGPSNGHTNNNNPSLSTNSDANPKSEGSTNIMQQPVFSSSSSSSSQNNRSSHTQPPQRQPRHNALPQHPHQPYDDHHQQHNQHPQLAAAHQPLPNLRPFTAGSKGRRNGSSGVPDVVKERLRSLWISSSSRRANSASVERWKRGVGAGLGGRGRRGGPSAKNVERVPRDPNAPPSQSKLYRKFRLVGVITVVLIRLKAAIVVASLDRTERSAAEIQWRTLYGQQEAEKLAFNKDIFCRDKGSTRMPHWATIILDTLPENRTAQDCRRLHALFRDMRAFDKFTEEIQLNLCRAFTYFHVEESRVVLRRGHIGYLFYFIYSGSVFVNVQDIDNAGQPFIKTEAILGRGDSFGELALLQDIRRTATVSVREKCELLAVDKDIFSQVCPQIFEKELGEKKNFIYGLALFNPRLWTQEALKTLCIEAQIQEYKTNKIIVENNQTDEWLYICMEGKCHMIRCLSDETKEGGDDDEVHTRERSDSAAVLSQEIIELLSSATHINGKEEEEEEAEESSKAKLLSSLGLEYVGTGKRKGAFIEEVAEEERRKAQLAASGPMTLTSLITQQRAEGKTGLVYLHVGSINNEEVFDLKSLLKEPGSEKSSSMLLVSCGARMLRVRKTTFTRLASFEAMQATKTLYSKQAVPSEATILQSYKTQVTWDAFKVKVVKEVVRSSDLHRTVPPRAPPQPPAPLSATDSPPSSDSIAGSTGGKTAGKGKRKAPSPTAAQRDRNGVGGLIHGKSLTPDDDEKDVVKHSDNDQDNNREERKRGSSPHAQSDEGRVHETIVEDEDEERRQAERNAAAARIFPVVEVDTNPDPLTPRVAPPLINSGPSTEPATEQVCAKKLSPAYGIGPAPVGVIIHRKFGFAHTAGVYRPYTSPTTSYVPKVDSGGAADESGDVGKERDTDRENASAAATSGQNKGIPTGINNSRGGEKRDTKGGDSTKDNDINDGAKDVKSKGIHFQDREPRAGKDTKEGDSHDRDKAKRSRDAAPGAKDRDATKASAGKDTASKTRPLSSKTGTRQKGLSGEPPISGRSTVVERR